MEVEGRKGRCYAEASRALTRLVVECLPQRKQGESVLCVGCGGAEELVGGRIAAAQSSTPHRKHSDIASRQPSEVNGSLQRAQLQLKKYLEKRGVPKSELHVFDKKVLRNKIKMYMIIYRHYCT